jgi:hypothetical protein
MLTNNTSNINNDVFKTYFEYILGLLAAILIFRLPATIFINLFIIGNIVFYRKISYERKMVIPILLISIPFLLNLVFIWNNDSLLGGIKHTEKYILCFFLPIILVLQRFQLSIKRIFIVYSTVFTLTLLCSFIIHVLSSLDQFEKYLKGIEVWKMGYSYAISMDLHAPALNMHIAFLTIVNLYLVLKDINLNKLSKYKYFRIVLFIISLILLLIVNTRMAILITFIGIPLISADVLLKRMTRKKAIKIISSIMGVFFLFVLIFTSVFPYFIKKYTQVTFKHIDKIGELDSLKNPEAEVYSALVTRLSIWKTSIETIQPNIIYGVGSADSKRVLIKAYIDSNQQFLAKYKFPIHNQYLDFALKFGVLGLIGVILYVFNILFLAIKTKKSFILFFFILFFSSNLTDDFLIRYDGIVFSALWISIFSNLAYSRKDILKPIV